MSETQIAIQTLNTDYFGHNYDIGSVSANDPDKNIKNLNISIVNGKLNITWDDCDYPNWNNNIVIRAKNYIPASTYNEGIIDTIYTRNGHSLNPLIDDNIQVNTLYCYRIFTEFNSADDLYSGFKNIFFVYTYDPSASTGVHIGTDVIDAGMILLNSTHKFVTDAQIANWNAKADQITTYTKTEVDGLINSHNNNIVTQTTNGLMSSVDKVKLDGLVNYTHPATHPVSMITGLATIATSGNYNDLINKPTMPTLATVATSGSYNDLLNKPALSTVATSGNYNDLLNKPALPTFAAVATSGNYNDLINKPTIPTFAAVATTGSYTDLLNKPTIPTVSTAGVSGSYNDLLNKPTFATVATSGDYNDLINKPVLPTFATVATSGKYTDLLNKPTFATVATSGSYTDLINKPSLSTVATSGSYNDLLNKPTIPVLPTLAKVATSGDFNDLLNIPAGFDGLATVATTGSYFDLKDTPLYAAVAASGSYTDLVNKPAIPSIVAKGSSTFAGAVGITITIPTQTNTNYIVTITPSGNSTAANPGGSLGEVYVVKSTSYIKVYNSGNARTTFDYLVM